jgi:hypothetical protein
LKPCHTPPDTQVEPAQPPRRGRPPKATSPTAPPAPPPLSHPAPPPLSHPAPPPGHPNLPPSRKPVTFRCPAALPPPARFHPSGRPARSTARPSSYAT